MELQLAVLADAANVSQQGKLNILGEFDTIYTPSLPITWPAMVYVAKIVASTADGVQYTFELRVVRDDGTLVYQLPFGGQIDPRGFEGGNRPRFPVILPIANATFDAYGEYTFELRGNGRLLEDGVPLYVRPQPSQPATQ